MFFVDRRLLALCLALFACKALAAQTVINSGVPGENTTELRARSAAAIAASKPAYVIVFEGMNDAVNEKKFLTPAQSGENIEAIISDIQAAHATPVLVTVHAPDDARLLARHNPSVYADRSPSQRVRDVNTILQNIAKRQHVMIADFYTALQQAGGANSTLSTDGVHLTPTGYRLLATTIRGRLPKQMRGETILCLGDSLTYGIGVRAANSAEETAETYPAQLRQILTNPHDSADHRQ